MLTLVVRRDMDEVWSQYWHQSSLFTVLYDRSPSYSYYYFLLGIYATKKK